MPGLRSSMQRRAGYDLSFEGLPGTAVRAGSLRVLRLLEKHFQCWPFSLAQEGSSPLFTVKEKKNGFTVCSGREYEDFTTSAEMLCDLGIDLAEVFVAHSPGLQCLHCAAVALPCEGEQRLAVFPNVNMAGKSLLAACLMLQGVRVFADDLLGVTGEGVGVAFGLPPRLRLPLPSSVPSLAGVQKSMPGHGDERYHFLYPGELLASFGERLALGAVILPRRIQGEEKKAFPCLRRLSAGGALQILAYQFQIRAGQAGAVFELARSLCESLPLWVLEYDSPEEAAAFLLRQSGRLFASRPEEEEGVLECADFLTAQDRIFRSKHDRKRKAFPSDRNLRWLRAPGMHTYERGAFSYLIPEGQDDIFGVDGIGAAVLALLAEPLSISEAAGLLAEVFPQTGRDRLESDLSAFFQILYEQGLLVRASC